MATRKARLAFAIKRFKGFLEALRRSKRGLLGITVLIVSCIVAVSAPLLTHHHPITDRNLAGSASPPVWYRYFPGGESLSENFNPILDPEFSSSSALNEWNVTISPSVQNVFVQHVSDVGYPSSPGCLEVIYGSSSEISMDSEVKIQIMKEFYYPFSGIPGIMTIDAKVLLARIEGVSIQVMLVLQQNWPVNVAPDLFKYNVTKWYFGQRSYLYPQGRPEIYTEMDFTTSRRVLDWISPEGGLQFKRETEGAALRQLFPKAGNYAYGIEITIKKLEPSAEAIVYVDRLDIPLKGTAFGLLGTDGYGRDVYTQLIYGTQISLFVGLLATILSVVIGLVVGLVAAYLGGIADEVLMRFTDALIVLPGLPLMIILMTVLSSSQYNMTTFIIVIGFLGWMGFARVVRSQVLSLKERPYVEAAKAVGAGTPYILARHILPNVVSLIYVTLALSVPSAIVAEAALSFLGFVDPNVMSWGRMLQEGGIRPEYWWWVLPPGIAIAILSLSFILLGYALDEILNPKLRMRR